MIHDVVVRFEQAAGHALVLSHLGAFSEAQNVAGGVTIRFQAYISDGDTYKTQDVAIVSRDTPSQLLAMGELRCHG